MAVAPIKLLFARRLNFPTRPFRRGFSPRRVRLFENPKRRLQAPHHRARPLSLLAAVMWSVSLFGPRAPAGLGDNAAFSDPRRQAFKRRILVLPLFFFQAWISSLLSMSRPYAIAAGLRRRDDLPLDAQPGKCALRPSRVRSRYSARNPVDVAELCDVRTETPVYFPFPVSS